MTGSVTLDGVDRQLVHALQLDGRASFARIAAVLEVSERTVVRRYERLRSRLALRVTGVLDSRAVGEFDWFVRIRCASGARAALTGSLSRRPDTSWISTLTDGELVCIVHTPPRTDGTESFFEQLHAARGVQDVDAQCLLAPVAGVGGWPGRMTALTDEQQRRLAPAPPMPTPSLPAPAVPPGSRGRVRLSEEDRRLLAALASDARLPAGRLAALTGWSESTVRRRIAELRRAGALLLEVDIDPLLYGRPVEALCWAVVEPARLEDAGARLASHDAIAFAAVTTGTGNLLAMLECTDAAALHRLLGAIGALPGVRELRTALTDRRVTRAGSVLRLA